MRVNECSCGCGRASQLSKNDELDSYMFFGNLQTIKRSVDALMKMSPTEVDEILNNGHDWAADHVATAKDDLQEVADFFMNKMMTGVNSKVMMMGDDHRLIDTLAVKTFESFLHKKKTNKTASKPKNRVKKDQDEDGDNDFVDAKIAQYIAGGMSKDEAIKKARKFNK